ncbi:hypothetical protein VB773_02525 [Haloarculaceae archaeon H-GB2-1]|nr:hypothetical protein [Haloarculaceae archaeon H-GB1-1]MEA5406564.1 hypothetical protein [Haloarculaceae archaeon H-GB2-1]
MTETRRRLLLAVGSAVTAGLAGCSDASESAADETTATETTAPSAAATETTTGPTESTPSPTAEDGLDLREANVTGVEVERTDSAVRFDVTLYHDDDGEDGYANYWVVEDLDGSLLGTRKLTHAHGTREFTRSKTISIPDDVTCVVVRGHDQTHQYGGQAMTVNLETGETRGVQQGTERQPVTEC